MSKYEDLCQAYAKTEPRRLRVHQIVDELPERLRQAIAADLEAPSEQNLFLTNMFKRPLGYVFHARKVLNDNGQLEWQAVGDGRLLERGNDGVLRFGIGVALEKASSSNLPVMIYLRFSIEDNNESAVKLLIENRDGLITINPSGDDGYSNAAAIVTTWLKQILEDPTLGAQSNIGFSR